MMDDLEGGRASEVEADASAATLARHSRSARREALGETPLDLLEKVDERRCRPEEERRRGGMAEAEAETGGAARVVVLVTGLTLGGVGGSDMRRRDARFPSLVSAAVGSIPAASSA